MNLSQTRRNKSKWCTIAVTVNGCQYLSLKYQYQYPCLKYKYKHQYQYKYLKMVLKYRSSTSTSTQYYNPGTQQTWLLTTTTSFFDNAIDLPWLNFLNPEFGSVPEGSTCTLIFGDIQISLTHCGIGGRKPMCEKPARFVQWFRSMIPLPSVAWCHFRSDPFI